jgi:hypothetical protein
MGLSRPIQNLVLDRADGPPSLAASLSSVVELLKDRINVTIANEVCWGTRSVLASALSHFPEIGLELELLGSGGCPWTQVCLTSDSLVSFVPPSTAYGSPDGVGVEQWW